MTIRVKSPRQNYLSSITGPQLATISGSTITYNEKYPLLVLSGGLKVESNLNQRYNVLSVDPDFIQSFISGSGGGGGSGDKIESPDGTTVFIQAFDEEKLESYVTGSTGVYHSVISGTYEDFGTPLPIINKKEMLESGDFKASQTTIASSDMEVGVFRAAVFTGADEWNTDNESLIELYGTNGYNVVTIQAKNTDTNTDASIEVGGSSTSFIHLFAGDTGEFRLYPDFAYVMISGSTGPVTIVNSGAPNLPTGMNSIVHGLHVLSSSITHFAGASSQPFNPGPATLEENVDSYNVEQMTITKIDNTITIAGDLSITPITTGSCVVYFDLTSVGAINRPLITGTVSAFDPDSVMPTSGICVINLSEVGKELGILFQPAAVNPHLVAFSVTWDNSLIP